MSAQVLLVSLGGAASDRIADPLLARGYTVHAVGGANAATRALPGHDLVIVDAAAAAAAADACTQLRKVAGPTMPILAVSPTDDIDDRIALLQAGADDVLTRIVDGRELAALAEALLASRRPPSPARAGTPSSTATGGAGELLGRVIVFAAAKGGAGTTTLAVNTAILLARSGAHVAIADLDLHHGQVAAHLDVTGGNSTAQLARDEQLPGNPLLVRSSAVKHDSGLSVLPAPMRPDEGALVTADDVLELVGALRRAYGSVVIDAGSVAGSRALTLIGVADVSIIVVTPDIPGLRAVQGALDAAHDAGVIGDQTSFVLNRPHAQVDIAADEIERNLAVKLAAEVPHDAESSMRAVNEGTPVVALAPRSRMAEALAGLAAIAMGESTQESPTETSPPTRRRGIGGILRRR